MRRLLAALLCVIVLASALEIAFAATAVTPCIVTVDATVSGPKQSDTARIFVTVTDLYGRAKPDAGVVVSWRFGGTEIARWRRTDSRGALSTTLPLSTFRGSPVTVSVRTASPLAGAGTTKFSPAVWNASTTAENWSWHSGPIAVREVGAQDRTYIGSVSRNGEIVVRSIDHRTGDESRTVLYRYKPDETTGDDHNNPSILVRRSDRRIIVFWSGHTSKTIQWRISRNPEDISSFGPVRTLTDAVPDSVYTYTHPVELSDEGKIYLFGRRRGRFDGRSRCVWDVAVSIDNGATFTRNSAPLWGQADVFSPYTEIVSNNRDKIWFLRSDWMMGRTSEWRRGPYVSYYRSGSFWKPDGSLISTWGALPIESANQLDQIARPTEEGFIGAYGKDIELDAKGRPRIVYSTLTTNSRNTYWSGTWTGSGWRIARIADGGRSLYPTQLHPHYDAGIELDPVDPDVAYLGREVGQGVVKRFVVERWRTKDGGQTWNRELRLSAPGAPAGIRDMRPVVPVNRHDQLRVLWLRGTYWSYYDWSTRLMGATGQATDMTPRVREATSPAEGALDAVTADRDLYRVELSGGQRLVATLDSSGTASVGLSLLGPGARGGYEDDPAAAVRSNAGSATLDVTVPRTGGGTYLLAVSALRGQTPYRLGWKLEPSAGKTLAGGITTGTLEPARRSDTYWTHLEAGEELRANITGDVAVRASLVSPPNFGSPLGTRLASGRAISFRVPAGAGGLYSLRVGRSTATTSTYMMGARVRRVTRLGVTAPVRTIDPGKSATIVFRLTDSRGRSLQKTLLIQRSADGRTWSTLRRARTSPTGAAVLVTAPAGRTYYRARFAGDVEYCDKASSAIAITPRVRLGTPLLSRSAIANEPFPVTGYLSPRHRPGSSSVRLLVDRRTSTGWRRTASVATVNRDVASRTAYKALLRLPAGRWRVRAYARADGLHAATYSADYGYVTVRAATRATP